MQLNTTKIITGQTESENDMDHGVAEVRILITTFSFHQAIIYTSYEPVQKGNYSRVWQSGTSLSSSGLEEVL